MSIEGNAGIADATIEAGYSVGDVFSAQSTDEYLDTVTSVTPLASGGFVIVRSTIDDSLTQGIRAQIFDADGAPVGTDFLLDIPSFGSGLAVAGLAGGGFAVAFDTSTSSGLSVAVQRFDAAGHEIGAQATLDPGEGGFHEPRIAALENGGFVVTWEKPLFDGVTSSSDVFAQVFDAAGNKLGGEITVSGEGHEQRLADVVGLPNGGFVVVWHDMDNYDPDYAGSIKGQYFDAAGARVGGEFAVLADNAGVYGGPQVAVLADGNIAVGWLEEIDYDADVYGSRFQIVGANGTNVGASVPVVAYTGYPEQTLTATPDGGFVVTWSAVNPAGDSFDDRQSWAQFFDASGAPVDDAFIVDDSPAGSESPAHVGILTSGELVFAWTRLFVEDGRYTSDAYARIFSLADVVGTAGDDTLTAGAGNHTLIGDAGNDTLDGGAGADTMIGGLGNDTYLVDNAGDAVVEEAGAGTDGVRTALAGYTLGANVEQLTYTGGGAFTGSGNNLGNRLIGGAGDDVLSGFGGADVLVGEAGRDRLDGGNGVDTADYSTASAGVTVRLDRISAQNTGGGGIDTLANVENLTGSAHSDKLLGSAGTNVLEGGDGNDVLDGLAGNDTMRGGAGDDVFYVDATGDKVIETTGSGWDVVRAGVDYSLANNVEELFIAGAARNGTGNALANTLHGSGSSNTLSGLAGDDILRGGDGRDVLLGGDGADLLDGGVGKDALTGGAGRDVFQFRDGDFGTTRALADVIADFSHADKEKVHLGLVDADTALAGDQAFAFIGNGAFTGVAGQLHHAQAAGNTYVEGDTNGDGAADFVIALTGLHGLVAGDFVL